MDNLGFVSDSLSLPGLPSDNCGSPLAAEGGLVSTDPFDRYGRHQAVMFFLSPSRVIVIDVYVRINIKLVL